MLCISHGLLETQPWAPHLARYVQNPKTASQKEGEFVAGDEVYWNYWSFHAHCTSATRTFLVHGESLLVARPAWPRTETSGGGWRNMRKTKVKVVKFINQLLSPAESGVKVALRDWIKVCPKNLESSPPDIVCPDTPCTRTHLPPHRSSWISIDVARRLAHAGIV